MSELKSKCCGAEVKWGADFINTYTQADLHGKTWICQECHKPCEVEETNKPQDTALYASLRR